MTSRETESSRRPERVQRAPARRPVLRSRTARWRSMGGRDARSRRGRRWPPWTGKEGGMLSVEGVSKAYRGGPYGVRDLSCEAKPGVLGLLGPERRGQDDADADDRHGHAADGRPHPLRRQRRRRRTPRPSGAGSATCRRTSASTTTSPRSSSSTTWPRLKGVRSRARVIEMLELVNLHTVAHRPPAASPAACGSGSASPRRSRRPRPPDRGRADGRASTPRSASASATSSPGSRAGGS